MFLASTIRKARFYLWLGLGCCSFSLGWILFLGRFFYGINVITLPVANIFILLLPIFLKYGICSFLRVKKQSKIVKSDILTLSILFAFLCVVMENKTWPAFSTSLINAVYYSIPAMIIYKKYSFKKTISNIIIIANVLISFVLVFRATIFIASMLISDFITPNMANFLLYNTLFLNILVVELQVLCFPLLDFMHTQEKIETHNEELKFIVNHDQLTGLFNRRALLEKVDIVLKNCREFNQELTLILFDIDHFKLVNDEFGHPAGDRVLVHIASTIRNLCRADDFLVRYGGEEFVLLLPQTSIEKAIIITERMRHALETTPPQSDHLPLPNRVTASFGVAGWEKNWGIDELLHAADTALYEAKNRGRNCIYVHRPRHRV